MLELSWHISAIFSKIKIDKTVKQFLYDSRENAGYFIDHKFFVHSTCVYHSIFKMLNEILT